MLLLRYIHPTEAVEEEQNFTKLESYKDFRRSLSLLFQSYLESSIFGQLFNIFSINNVSLKAKFDQQSQFCRQWQLHEHSRHLFINSLSSNESVAVCHYYWVCFIYRQKHSHLVGAWASSLIFLCLEGSAPVPHHVLLMNQCGPDVSSGAISSTLHTGTMYFSAFHNGLYYL